MKKRQDGLCLSYCLEASSLASPHITQHSGWYQNTQYVIYITKNVSIFDYPHLIEHLKKYKSILEKKRECVEGKIPWYSLHWPRDNELLASTKIVCPRRSHRNYFALEHGKNFEQSDIMFMVLKGRFSKTISNYYVLGVLNSKLYYFWFYEQGKRKGEALELYGAPLSEAPLLVAEPHVQYSLESLVRRTIYEKDQQNILANLRAIDQLVYQIYDLTPEEIAIVEEAAHLIK